MFSFIKNNWFQVFLSVGILAGYVNAYIEAAKVSALENNHIHTLEKAVDEIKREVTFIREETVKQWREISEIQGQLKRGIK